MARRHLQIDLCQFLDEEVAVLRVHNGLYTRAKHADAILLEHTVLVERRTDVQSRLSAPSQHDAVRTFLLDNLLYEIGSDGQEIDLVGNAFTGLDGCHVGIDEHRIDAFLTKSLECLTAGIVKLACLTNLQGTAA